MENKAKKGTIPMINQVFRNAASGHLAECGLPESLIDCVDCSTYETMESSLQKIKDCFYSAITERVKEQYSKEIPYID